MPSCLLHEYGMYLGFYSHLMSCLLIDFFFKYFHKGLGYLMFDHWLLWLLLWIKFHFLLYFLVGYCWLKLFLQILHEWKSFSLHKTWHNWKPLSLLGSWNWTLSHADPWTAKLALGSLPWRGGITLKSGPQPLLSSGCLSDSTCAVLPEKAPHAPQLSSPVWVGTLV